MEVNRLLICVFWSVFCLTECVRRNDVRRQRRQVCRYGTYMTRNGLNCCLCPKGFYLQADCTSNLTHPTCNECASQTFLNHANNEDKCELCKTCGNNDNKVTVEQCTLSSNTVCRCQDDYYCSNGDECKVCYRCSSCEFGIKVPCSTNDTQCNEERPDGVSLRSVRLPVLVSFSALIIIIIVLFVIWYQKRRGVKQRQSQTLEKQELLPDVNLEPFLPRIAEVLGFKVVRDVVRRQSLLSRTTIEDIIYTYRDDPREQSYQLLVAWYEKHGMYGAYGTLHENLIAINKRSVAENVREIIRETQT